MALIEADLFTFLTGIADVTALVGTRIYPNLAPKDATYPCITFQKVSTVRVRDMSGESGLVQTRIQINCWGKDSGATRGYASAKSVADRIRKELDSKRGTMGTSTVDAAFLLDESDAFNPGLAVGDSVIHGVRQDWQIRHRETVDDNTN